ncbi:hypothetical protein Hypma_005513 [Hypsizygus marmoreus]|uniref:Uncharacterized protein n=1 Tax=Hypsizygus marmoreus TaxID=39966 RepID=A0A369J1K3_HYPMA|nr:hypothetical protein Hypma_005513 [Hypsizygus marmoreus]
MKLMILSTLNRAHSPVPKGEPIDEETDKWPVPVEHQISFNVLKRTHCVMPLIVYNANNNMVLPEEVTSKIKGLLVELHFHLHHYYISGSSNKFNSFTGIIEQVVILRPPVPKNPSPYHNNVYTFLPPPAFSALNGIPVMSALVANESSTPPPVTAVVASTTVTVPGIGAVGLPITVVSAPTNPAFGIMPPIMNVALPSISDNVPAVTLMAVTTFSTVLCPTHAAVTPLAANANSQFYASSASSSTLSSIGSSSTMGDVNPASIENLSEDIEENEGVEVIMQQSTSSIASAGEDGSPTKKRRLKR